MSTARTPIIDFHVHLLNERVNEASTGRTVFSGFGLVPALYQRIGRGARVAKMYDPAAQIDDMDVRGIDMHVITSSTVIRRLDRNAANRPDTLRNTGGKKPSDFLRSFYFDTCVYDPQVLTSLRTRIGPDRLVLGSDYPVGEDDPVGFLKRCGLEGHELKMVAGGNAANLLGPTTT